MRVLVIGGGGREHALVWKIRQSPGVEKIYCAPGNAGTAELAENADIPADDIETLAQFARERNIGLTVVGPEQPLVLGIVDRFRALGLRIFGPTADAARLEGSKAFSKELMKKYGIPTADFQVFDDPAEAKKYARARKRIIVKADGLAAGKGVFLCKDLAQAEEAIDRIMTQKAFGAAGDKVVLEEFLEGREISLLAFVDGKTILPLEAAQDHKTVYDGDRGPNTGGMGAYSPAPLLTPGLLDRAMCEIMHPAVEAMAAENCPYQGILYAGLMLTREGPKVLEFNARFGDPETQPLLMRMESDIVPLMEACIDGSLNKHKLEWSGQSAVCVVMTAEGYPGNFVKGRAIKGLAAAAQLPGSAVFHAGTRLDGGNVLTHGGRVLGVTALGKDLPTAIGNAYSAVAKISWDGVHYRKDIGQRPA
ncbi:MAG: phosphoribosylamine--glycine ligase [Nitrospinae bacterium]|nr:phosphoribosylamine--glycine ligase [Nitrospinota bacterium]